MPAQKRFKTKYPGVSYIEGLGIDGKPEKIYMIRCRKAGEIVSLDVDRLRIKLLKNLAPQTVKHVLNFLTWIIR